MKQVKIRSLKYPDPAINWDFQAEGPQTKLDELLASGVCGLPERIVLHNDEPMAEPYDDADVLEEIIEEVSPATDELPAVTVKKVKLKAEYTISIEDITEQHNLQQIIAKRKAEYPSAEEFMNAFFDGGDEALAALQAKRLEIKAKYPKINFDFYLIMQPFFQPYVVYIRLRI